MKTYDKEQLLDDMIKNIIREWLLLSYSKEKLLSIINTIYEGRS